MTKNFYENTYKIRYSEVDCNLSLKPSSLLQLLQDIASENAENLGFGYSFLVEKNLGWFLLKLHLEFDNYPEDVYNLTIKTEPRGWNRLFAHRDFELLNGSQSLGKAATTWGLIDLNSKSMTNIGEVLADNPRFTPFEKRDDDLKYNKILSCEDFDSEKIFEIRFDDIDVNQHVNNSNYLVWAFETLDYAFRRNKKLKTLDMTFKKEIKYGNRILSQLKFVEDKTVHVLKNAENGDELCLVQAQWI